MTQAEKTMLRYQYVMANSTKAQLDFQRTSSTWHNQIVILKQQLQQLAIVIGSGLIQAIKPFVMQMNAALSGLITFAQNVVNALGKIFGWEMEINTKGLAIDDSDFDYDTGGLEDVADAADDAADSTDKAAKAAKKLNDQLQGFDKLNVLRTTEQNKNKNNKSGTDSDSGTGNGSGVSGGEASAMLKKTKGAFESNIDSLYELGKYIQDKLIKAMGDIDWKKVYAAAQNFGTGLAKFLNGLISPKLFASLGETIANAIRAALIGSKAFADNFDFGNLGLSINVGLRTFLEKFPWKELNGNAISWATGLADLLNNAISPALFADIGRSLADVLNSAFTFLNTFGQKFNWDNFGTSLGAGINAFLHQFNWGTVFSAASTWGRGLATTINSAVKMTSFKLIGESLAKALDAVLTFLYNFANKLEWTMIGKKLADGVNGFIERFPAAKLARTINKWVQGIYDLVVTAVTNIKWDKLGGKIKEFISNIDFKTVSIIIKAIALKKAAGLAVSLGASLISAIGSKISTELNMFLSAKLPTIFSALSGLANTLAPLVLAIGGIVVAAKGLFDIWTKGWTGARQIMVTVGSAIAIAVGVITGVLTGPLAIAIAGAVAAFSFLAANHKKIFEGIKQKCSEFSESWKVFCDGFWSALSGAVDGICNGINFLQTTVSNAWTTITSNVGRCVRELQTSWSDLVSQAKNMGSDLRQQWESLKADVGNAIQNIKDTVATKCEEIKTAVVNKVEAIKTGVVEKWTTLKDSIGSKMTEIKDAIVNKWSEIKTAAWNAIAGEDSILSKAKSGFESVKNGIKEKMSTVKESVSEKWDAIKEAAGTKIDKIKSVVGNKFENVKKAVTNKIDAAKTSVNNVWKAIKDTAHSEIPEIQSKVTEKFNNVAKAIKKPFDTVKTFFSNIWTNIKTICGNGVVGIHNEIVSKFNNMISKLSGIGKTLQGLFKFKLPTFHFQTTTLELANLRITYPSGITATWNRKAYDNPLMFTNPTVVPTALGYQGFGDGQGGEIVYGHANLMKDIREATGGSEMTAIGNRQLANDQRIIQLLSIIAEKEFGISGDALFRNMRDQAQNYTNRTGKQAFEF